MGICDASELDSDVKILQIKPVAEHRQKPLWAKHAGLDTLAKEMYM